MNPTLIPDTDRASWREWVLVPLALAAALFGPPLLLALLFGQAS